MVLDVDGWKYQVDAKSTHTRVLISITLTFLRLFEKKHLDFSVDKIIVNLARGYLP